MTIKQSQETWDCTKNYEGNIEFKALEIPPLKIKPEGKKFLAKVISRLEVPLYVSCEMMHRSHMEYCKLAKKTIGCEGCKYFPEHEIGINGSGCLEKYIEDKMEGLG